MKLSNIWDWLIKSLRVIWGTGSTIRKTMTNINRGKWLLLFLNWRGFLATWIIGYQVTSELAKVYLLDPVLATYWETWRVLSFRAFIIIWRWRAMGKILSEFFLADQKQELVDSLLDMLKDNQKSLHMIADAFNDLWAVTHKWFGTVVDYLKNNLPIKK